MENMDNLDRLEDTQGEREGDAPEETGAQTESMDNMDGMNGTLSGGAQEDGDTGAYAGDAASGADAGELPTLTPPGELTSPRAVPAVAQGTGSAESDVLSDALALMGVSDTGELIKQLEQSAIDKLVAAGAPEALAKEIIALRRAARVNAGAYRARDEPAAPMQQAAQGEFSPELDRLARQADYIHARTGVDMLEAVRNAPDMLSKLSAYARGEGSYDMMAAYEDVRKARTQARKRVPPTTQLGGGQTGSGKRDVRRMTDAELDELEVRAMRGESIVL